MQVSDQSRPPAATIDAGRAVLHLVCGKIGSGKSTLARQLASQPNTVMVSEDSWPAGLACTAG
ncbi:Uncharacterised protein [Delftia tsuruhatensis]|nr:Uncharacterised protein [Delftia tsuruhatensis]CAC9683744.1 Uncharacterised protein [Delftia tsuruhatensis]